MGPWWTQHRYNEKGPFLLLLDCFSAIAIVVWVVLGPLRHLGTLFLEGLQGLVPPPPPPLESFLQPWYGGAVRPAKNKKFHLCDELPATGVYGLRVRCLWPTCPVSMAYVSGVYGLRVRCLWPTCPVSMAYVSGVYGLSTCPVSMAYVSGVYGLRVRCLWSVYVSGVYGLRVRCLWPTCPVSMDEDFYLITYSYYCITLLLSYCTAYYFLPHGICLLVHPEQMNGVGVGTQQLEGTISKC